jgi:hypothetical protein
MHFEKPISVDVETACRASGLTRNQVYGAMRDGKLKTAHVGKRRLVLWASLEKFIEANMSGIDPAASERSKVLRAKRTAKAKPGA